MRMIFLLFLYLTPFVHVFCVDEIPKFSAVKDGILSSEARLYDRNSKILHELRRKDHERRLDWINLSEVSNFFLDAVIIAEDKRFYDHSGVDLLALGSSFFRFFTSSPTRGASTITMQLATLLKEELQSKSRKSLYQKWLQILNAKNIEDSWSKEEILEAYINLVTYRGELVGLDAASKGLFGKSPHGLDKLEGILLAAMIKSPSARPQRISERACFIYQKIDKNPDCKELSDLTEKILNKPYSIRPTYAYAPSLAHRFLPKNSSSGIQISIDRDLQIFSKDVLQKHLLSIKEKNVQDGAILILNNHTNEILSYIGNSGNLSSAIAVDAIHARRQAGSTLKPFLYALAFEKKYLTAMSLLSDNPLEIQVGTGIYSPLNYKGIYNGMVSSRYALASSLNIPAIHTLELVGVDHFHEFLEDIGFEKLNSPDHYGLSMALGSIDVTLWELVSAYSILSRKGIFSQMSFSPNNQPENRRVLSEETAFLVSNILSDRDARSLSFGLENPLSTRYGASVKTGTSKDMRDNWCIGYTDYYTVGVWVGNFNGEPMWNVSGTTGAAPIWAEIMDHLHTNVVISPNTIPKDLVEVELKNKEGIVVSKEFFIRGTENPNIPEPAVIFKNGIISPIKDSIIGLDPDIPKDRQKIFFEPKIFSKHNHWRLDGKIQGEASEIHLYSPELGVHILELVGNQNEVLEKIKFEVR